MAYTIYLDKNMNKFHAEVTPIVDKKSSLGDLRIAVGYSKVPFEIEGLGVNTYLLWSVENGLPKYYIRFSIAPDCENDRYRITVYGKQVYKENGSSGRQYEAERYLATYKFTILSVAQAIINDVFGNLVTYTGTRRLVSWEEIHTNAIDFLMEQADAAYEIYTQEKDPFCAGECAGYVSAARMLIEEFFPNNEIICGRFEGKHGVRREIVTWEA